MTGSNPTVICAISHGLYEPWISILKNGQKKTWLAEKFPEGFQVIHFHGTPVNRFWLWLDKFHEKLRWTNIWTARILKFLDNFLSFPFLNYIPKIVTSHQLDESAPSLHIIFPDTYVTYRWKLLSLLNYFVEHTEDDFLLVTSTASYIQPNLVMRYLREIPSEGVYAGAEPYPLAGFISGSNRVFSRRVAKQILDNRAKWKTGVIEDVAVTDLLKKIGVKLVKFPIKNISSLEELAKIPDSELMKSYHFRLKSGSMKNRNDVEIMNQLHLRVRKLKRSEDE